MDVESNRSVEGGREKDGKKIVVLMVGPPGSGKTTFCSEVMKNSARSWVRICQDSIAGGKAGTKSQCLKCAAEALQNDKSVFIDRCNLDRDQRADFVKLGSPSIDVHAVVLDLPAKLCISRSVNRINHEGNLQGGKAAAVVNRMLNKKELPKLDEGFSRIVFCNNDHEVQGCVETYKALAPWESLLPGCFGKNSADSKVQLDLMRFFKKVEIPNNVGSYGNMIPNYVSKEENKEINLFPVKDNSIRPPAGNVDEKILEDRKSLVNDNSSNDIFTLAFPSISTADFQFNQEKACDVIIEEVSKFLCKVENVRLVMVDLSEKSKMLSLVRAKAAQKDVNSNKFFTFVGDITRLYSEGKLQCNVIANATNWRLKPGGGGVNAAIFSVAGPSFITETEKCGGMLKPGQSIVVPVPSDSPLYKREGVTHVIHALGPNMNPQRPNFLGYDYVQGCKVLRETYSSLFENFASIGRPKPVLRKISHYSVHESPECHENSLKDHPGPFINSKQKIKRENYHDPKMKKKCKDNMFDDGIKDESATKHMFPCDIDASAKDVPPKNDRIDTHNKKSWSSWAQALHRVALHPEKQHDNVLEILDDIVVLNDLFPKARKHILVLARTDGLDRLADVCKEHLPLLGKMHSIGLKWAKKFLQDDESLIFRLGYHSVPSMRQLHLHVISQDFDSPHLKNKKHWNSFTTAFFRDSKDVIEEVKNHNKALFERDENLLSTELRCHRCKSAHPNIPRLKSHIVNCKASFPSSLLQNGCLVFSPTRAADQV